MAFARQFFKGILKKDKVYPWTLAKLVKAQGGGTVQDFLDGTKKVSKSVNADNVPWGGVSNKPSTYPPSSHSHDERYFTETEINNLFNSKLAKFKSVTLHNITVNPAGKNYFDIGRNTNQFIIPAHVHTQILNQVQYGQTSVRILLRDACSTNIGFYYLIITV